jgi:hypothetical protein
MAGLLLRRPALQPGITPAKTSGLQPLKKAFSCLSMYLRCLLRQVAYPEFLRGVFTLHILRALCAPTSVNSALKLLVSCRQSSLPR